MACFIVPMVEAVVTTTAAKVLEAKETPADTDLTITKPHRFTKELKALSNLLWGGSALLAFEHIWHGEVIPWFPFLTAASDPAELSEMLHEMSTVGVTMALLVTAVWGIGCLILRTAAKQEDPMPADVLPTGDLQDDSKREV